MNCKHYQKQILLQDAGELPKRQRIRLAHHIQACPACHALQEEIQTLHSASRANAEPSNAVLSSVHRMARQMAPTPRRATAYPLFKPAFVGAVASLAILLALIAKPSSSDKAYTEFVLLDAQLLEPHEQVAHVINNGFSDDDLAFNFLMTYDVE